MQARPPWNISAPQFLGDIDNAERKSGLLNICDMEGKLLRDSELILGRTVEMM